MSEKVINKFWIYNGEGFNIYAPYEILLPYDYVRISPRKIIEHKDGRESNYPNGDDEHYIGSLIG